MTKTNKKIVPIFFATDDNYVPYLSVAINSLVSNASKNNVYKIHILYSKLSDASMSALSDFARPNITIEFNDVTEKLKTITNKLHTRDYYSKTTYYRLFIPNMFPEYDKALYLDGDIAILDDIANLYDYDLGNNMVGAVTDEAVSVVPEFINYVNNYLGIKESNYFNAGILSMNLDVLRKENFENKFINLIKQVKFTVAQDQDYLNVLCKDRVMYLPSVWNKMPIECNKQDVSELKLIHYNLSFKPWHYTGILYEEVFWKYAFELSIYNQIRDILDGYDDMMKLNDEVSGNNLKMMADNQANSEYTFKHMVLAGDVVL